MVLCAPSPRLRGCRSTRDARDYSRFRARRSDWQSTHPRSRKCFPFTYRRYEASGLLTPHTGSMEKHWASMMMGFMEACRLSVDGSKVSEGGMTGTERRRDTHLTNYATREGRSTAELTLGHQRVGLREVEPAIAQAVLGRPERYRSYTVGAASPSEARELHRARSTPTKPLANAKPNGSRSRNRLRRRRKRELAVFAC